MQKLFTPRKLEEITKPNITKKWITFWLIKKDNTIYKSIDFSDYLNEFETKQTKRILNNQAALDFAITRTQVKLILARYNQLTAIKEINFQYGTYGKPSFGQLAFNLTHGENYSLLAITNLKTIGIDLEKITQRPWEKTHARFFRQEEMAELLKIDKRTRLTSFYTLWVRKEAVLKAVGSHILDGLKKTSAHTDKEKYRVRLYNKNGEYDSTWLCPVKLNSDFIWSYAINNAEIDLNQTNQNKIDIKTIYALDDNDNWPELSYFYLQ